MNWRRKIILTIFMSVLAVSFLFPSVGFAVDFSITKVKIDAYLQENGQVKVNESHTYSFDGEFNGITREIVPKEGTSIINLKATENGKQLKVKREEDLYKIYRKGDDESITVDISYFIKNGVDVYSDVGEFYWPFFDERNESTYEKMNIVVHPPKETKEVIAFGYDEAFDKEKIYTDGSVLFQLGEVPSETNGDIRVAYDAAIFPSASIVTDKPMKKEIIKDKQVLYQEADAKAERQELFSKIALVIIPIFSIIILLFIIGSIMRARLKKLDVERRSEQSFFVPKEALSIPATIYFTAGQIPSEAVAAALMDLVRKGYVLKAEENHFKLINYPSNILKHEKILITFLFEEIGSNGEFTFENLKEYTKRKKNHEKYQSAITKWQQAIMNEVKEKGLHENNQKLRWSFAITSILLFTFVIPFLLNDLLGWLFASLVLSMIYLGIAIFYNPKNLKGLMIIHEWQLMKERIKGISTKDWETLSNDDQMRAYIYGIGIQDKKIMKKNEELIQSFKRPNSQPKQKDYHWDSSTVNINTMLLIGPLASINFHSAHKTTEATVSSSTSSSTGGGVGGGGGGSGAF